MVDVALRDPKVFLIAPKEEHNLKNASQFGKLVTVFSRGHRPNLTCLNAEVQYARRVLHKEQYTPSKDFICIIGAPLMTSVFFCALMADYHVTELKLLVFVAQEQRYQPRDISFEQEITDDDDQEKRQTA